MFPTMQTVSTGGAVPIHPQPSIFDTTIAHVLDEDGVKVVTPQIVDDILTRPRWNFIEADTRLTRERTKQSQAETTEAIIASRPQHWPVKVPIKKPNKRRS